MFRLELVAFPPTAEYTLESDLEPVYWYVDLHHLSFENLQNLKAQDVMLWSSIQEPNTPSVTVNGLQAEALYGGTLSLRKGDVVQCAECPCAGHRGTDLCEGCDEYLCYACWAEHNEDAPCHLDDSRSGLNVR